MGIDYFGHIEVKQGHAHVRRWGVIFPFLASLESRSGKSPRHRLNALCRVLCHRGPVISNQLHPISNQTREQTLGEHRKRLVKPWKNSITKKSKRHYFWPYCVDGTTLSSTCHMGCVVKTLIGSNGLVWSVLFETKTNILQRLLDKFSLLLEATGWAKVEWLVIREMLIMCLQPLTSTQQLHSHILKYACIFTNTKDYRLMDCVTETRNYEFLTECWCTQIMDS